MAGQNAGSRAQKTPQKLSMRKGLTTDRWVAIIVLASLAMLIGIRFGFRGVNVLGVKASVG